MTLWFGKTVGNVLTDINAISNASLRLIVSLRSPTHLAESLVDGLKLHQCLMGVS